MAELSASEFVSLAGHRQQSVRGAAGVSVAGVPARLHLRQYARRHPHRRRIWKASASACRSTPRPRRCGRAGICAHQFGVDLDDHPLGAGRGRGRRHPRQAACARRCSGRSRSSRTPAVTRSAMLLARGEIDALIGSRKPETFGRNPDVVRLFPNYRALERELYRNRRIFPIMHLDRDPARRSTSSTAGSPPVSTRRSWSRSGARGRACATADRSRTMLPWLLAEIEEIDAVFGGDACPYGVEPNRPTLEALVRYMVEQHFIARADPDRGSVRADPRQLRNVKANALPLAKTAFLSSAAARRIASAGSPPAGRHICRSPCRTAPRSSTADIPSARWPCASRRGE